MAAGQAQELDHAEHCRGGKKPRKRETCPGWRLGECGPAATLNSMNETHAPNPRISGYADPEGEAPWAMQLVLRLEKNHDGSEREAVRAVAKACVELLAEAEKREDWQRRVERWHQGRIRKIVRRARGNKWGKLIETGEGVAVEADGWEAWAEIPGPVDTVRKELSVLQISGTEVEGDWPESEAGEGPLVAVNPGLGISTGKLCAQVAHAAGLIWRYGATGGAEARRTVEEWRSQGVPMRLVRPGKEAWEALSRNVDFDNTLRQGRIVDAGFTEIPPGTPTVIWQW